MKRSRFTEDQIFTILKEADAGVNGREVSRMRSSDTTTGQVMS